MLRGDTPPVQSFFLADGLGVPDPGIIVEEREMGQIDIAFVSLQVVAFAQKLDGEPAIFRRRKKFVVGKSGGSPGPM
jgi:hypothetical protein